MNTYTVTLDARTGAHQEVKGEAMSVDPNTGSLHIWADAERKDAGAIFSRWEGVTVERAEQPTRPTEEELAVAASSPTARSAIAMRYMQMAQRVLLTPTTSAA